MALKFADFATTWLSAAIAAADTDCMVDDGGAFPALGADDHCYVVLECGVTREIVKVTAVNANRFQIERGQGDTTAHDFPQGALVDLRPVSVALEELQGGGRDDAELAEFIRDTIAATLRPGSGITITPHDGNDTITIADAGGGSIPPPAAFLRRAGISMDGTVDAAELIAGTQSMSENITLPTWASGSRYIGFWLAGQGRTLSTIEIVRVNRRAQFVSSALTVDGVDGVLFQSRQPHTVVYSGQEATLR